AGAGGGPGRTGAVRRGERARGGHRPRTRALRPGLCEPRLAVLAPERAPVGGAGCVTAASRRSPVPPRLPSPGVGPRRRRAATRALVFRRARALRRRLCRHL